MAPAEHSQLQLRNYQLDALTAIERAAARGVRRQVLALPTGTGKTVTFVELLRRRGGRSLVLVHRDELVQQASQAVGQVAPQLQVGVVKAERDEVEAQVVIASVQTLVNPARRARLQADFATVVVDEAHHAVADTYRAVLDHLGAFSEAGPLVLGVTATPERGDGIGLNLVFQEIVFQRDIQSMMEAGYLCDLRGVQVRLKVDFNELRVSHGDYRESDAERLLLSANAHQHAVSAYRDHADGRRALVFTPTVKMADRMAQAFVEAGVPAEMVSGDTPLDERRAMLRRLHDGATLVVANASVLTEGFDEPRLGCVIIARPTRSRPLYQQMIGRATRISPGKPDAIVLDLVGSATRQDLVTAGVLFGLPLRDRESVREAAVRVATEREAAKQDAAAVERLVAERIDLFRKRQVRWVVDPSGELFVVNLGSAAGNLTAELNGNGDGWDVVLYSELGDFVLKSGLDHGYAVGFIEDHARGCPGRHLVDPHARWLRLPLSDGQLRLAKRQRIALPAGATRGQAAEAISLHLVRTRRRNRLSGKPYRPVPEWVREKARAGRAAQ